MYERVEYFDQTKLSVAVVLLCVIGISACSSSSDQPPVEDDLDTNPTIPGNLISYVYSSHEAGLFWTASIDDGWVVGYDIFRDGVLVQEQLDANSFFEDLLTPSTTYQYQVVAVDDHGNQSLPAEHVLTTDSNGDVVDPGNNTGDIITVDNHIELLRYVFDILTGGVYVADMMQLPGYPDPAYDDFAVTGDSEVEMTTCINGGAATFTPFYNAGQWELVTGWDFEFDNCQYDVNVYDGMLDRIDTGNGTRFDLNSTGLKISSQSESTQFSGQVEYQPWGSRGGGPEKYMNVNDVDYSVTNTAESFELMDATFGMSVSPNGAGLRGMFSVSSLATNGQRLDVNLILSYNIFDCGVESCSENTSRPEFFQEGVLQLTAENGDSLLLDTATGDHRTVSIEITSGDVTETIVQPWWIWRENIKFNSDLLN